MPTNNDGIMVILSSPSGAGKTTLVDLLSKQEGFEVSISHTTRKPRLNEIHKKDYFFVNNEEFERLINNEEFLEYAKVFNNFYGSTRTPVINNLSKGKNVLFDIDWQGSKQIKSKNINFNIFSFFVLPPSRKVLFERLSNRDMKDKLIASERMKEFYKDLKHWIYKKEFHLSFLIAFIVFSPFIIWNLNNDFAFIRYQGAHATEGGDFEDFFELWLSLVILVGPLLYYYSVLYPLKKIRFIKKLNENSTYFIYITALPLIYFITHSIFSKFEINWPAPIFLSGLFIVGIKLGQIESFSRKILFQIGYSTSLIIVIAVQTFKPFLPINSKSDVTNRYHVYKDLLIEIPKILRDSPELRGLRIASNNYQIPSVVNFYLKPDLEATCLSIGYHETLYSFIHDDIIGEDFLFIKPKYGRPDWMESNFQSMSFIKEFTAIRDNNIIAKYSVWHLKNYLGKEDVY